MVFSILLLQVLVISSIIELGCASLGDRSHDFSFCKETCVVSNCGAKSKAELEWWLKLTGWSCQDNCLYTCMHEVTAEDVRTGRPIRQFYGKVNLSLQANQS